MGRDIAHVFIGGDWDADGLVSTALLTYSQEKLGKYPINTLAIVEKKPIDPERLRFIFGDLKGMYDLAIFLDLPYTNSVPRILSILKKHFGVKRIIYIDHHISTLMNKDRLEEVVDEIIVDKNNPTTTIVYNMLLEKGIQVHSRLRLFAQLVNYMDSGKRIPDNLMKLFELVKTLSKALTITRDAELWSKIVDWLASPTPLPLPLDESIMKKVREAIEKHDKLINEIATDLAVSAVKIGDFRFIDARRKWRYRGSSALASKLSSILKAPVILWIDTNKEYTLLVIKAFKGRAYRVAKYLLKEGIALDIAGHPNLAIVKISRNTNSNELREYIYKAVYYV